MIETIVYRYLLGERLKDGENRFGSLNYKQTLEIYSQAGRERERTERERCVDVNEKEIDMSDI